MNANVEALRRAVVVRGLYIAVDNVGQHPSPARHYSRLVKRL
jgi:hypothetical protein